MSNDKKCSTCGYSVVDPVWGEHKCTKKHRVCNETELINGCSDWEKPDTTFKVEPVQYIIPKGTKNVTENGTYDVTKYASAKVDVKTGSGENGATFIPNVSNEGVISWTNDKNLENPKPVNIKGEKGEDGYTPIKGIDYFDGNDGYTPQKGVDYWTTSDKTEIVNEVINSIPVYNGEVVEV